MVALLFGVSLLVALVATPLVAKGAIFLKVVDSPSGDRRMHTRPVPRLGGVAVAVSTLAGLLTAAFLAGGFLGLPAEEFRFVAGTLLAAGLLLAVGVVDDLRDLRPSWKLAAQLAAALLVYSAGFRIESLSLFPGFSLDLSVSASLALTVFWVVGMTNAFNLIDGLDGLATGVALVALLTTLAVAGALGNLGVVLASVALIGSLVGFLRYNFSPAQIFLGDSGSLFVGFLLSVLTVHGAQQADSGVLVVVPLLALALPIVDTALAIVRRWLRGVPLTGADARHIHHRFIALGFSHRRAAVVMCAIAGMLAALGCAVVFAPPAALIALATLGAVTLLALLLYGLHRLDYHEFMVAGSVVRAALRGGRAAIRNQIHAYDVSAIVSRAASLPQLRAILEDSAGDFGFLGMELCLESADSTAALSRLNGEAARAWKLDFPVCSRATADDEPLVLRIWCPLQRGGSTLNAERVAHLLALPIETALLRLESPEAQIESELAFGVDAIGTARSARGRAAPAAPSLSALPESPQRRPSLLRRVAGAAQ